MDTFGSNLRGYSDLSFFDMKRVKGSVDTQHFLAYVYVCAHEIRREIKRCFLVERKQLVLGLPYVKRVHKMSAAKLVSV